MAVTFKDYYAILGVDRAADAATIKKAYRKKARELHPDRNKSSGAEERFREVNESYEVLRDPDKRARYDQFGANWREGAQIDPEEFLRRAGGGGFRVNVQDLGDLGDLFGGGGARGGAGRGGRGRGGRTGAGGFSDFFEMLFGEGGPFAGAEGAESFGRAGGGGARSSAGRSGFRAAPAAGQDLQAEIELPLADFVQPRQQRVTIGVPRADGRAEPKTITLNVPPGLRPGQTLRLPGHGGAGARGGPAGHVYLQVRLRPEPGIEIEGDDLVTEVDVPAPIAVIGGTVAIRAVDGDVTVRVPPGTRAGTALRVRGRGLPRRDGTRGDLRARVRIAIPEHPTEQERELYRKLAELAQQGK